MHIKSILAGTAIALVAGLGSASAGEQFTALNGVPAEEMTPGEAAATRGGVSLLIHVHVGAGVFTPEINLTPTARDRIDGFPPAAIDAHPTCC